MVFSTALGFSSHAEAASAVILPVKAQFLTLLNALNETVFLLEIGLQEGNPVRSRQARPYLIYFYTIFSWTCGQRCRKGLHGGGFRHPCGDLQPVLNADVAAPSSLWLRFESPNDIKPVFLLERRDPQGHPIPSGDPAG